MIVRFAVANHRSILDPVELSLVAVDEDRKSVRRFERLSEGILPLAAIYGPNASGKSNVIDALVWVTSAVRSSLAAWEDSIPREPFKFLDGRDTPTIFEIDFIVDDVRYVYSLHLDDKSILFEELVSYPERRARQLFVREGLGLHFRRGLSGGSAIQELLTPTTLVLSLARRFEMRELRGPATYLARVSTPFGRRRFGSSGRSMYISNQVLNSTRRLFLQEYRYGQGEEGVPLRPGASEDLERARTLLKLADLGIDDVEVVKTDDRLDVRLVHKSQSKFALFSLDDESDGTQMWFRLIGPVLAALRAGTPLVLDEIDASLHPLLSAKLLDLFRDPKVNKRNAQLIFTTHDTSLLSELNRDEVWLTDKGSNAATELTALAEFSGERVRRSLNLEKAYLQGRFGGIPRIRESSLDSLMETETLFELNSELVEDRKKRSRVAASEEDFSEVADEDGET